MAALKAGDKAPNFKLMDQNGNTVSLKDFKGRKLLVYFYPKADTSGCTKQACSVRDAQPDLGSLGVAAVGVSPDKPDSQKKFDSKYSLGFPLLSDQDHEMAKAYGAWGTKSMYGKTYEGIIRSSFLIDEKGNILDVKYKVSPTDTVPFVKNHLEAKAENPPIKSEKAKTSAKKEAAPEPKAEAVTSPEKGKSKSKSVAKQPKGKIEPQKPAKADKTDKPAGKQTEAKGKATAAAENVEPKVSKKAPAKAKPKTEPWKLLSGATQSKGKGPTAAQVTKNLSELFTSQKYCVLSTEKQGEPYGNLVAFAASMDLKELLFVTPRNTTKFANIKKNPKISLLIDNRSNDVRDLTNATAVTVIGSAEEVQDKSSEQKLYLDKHPDLKDFLSDAESVIMKVKVDKFIVVSGLNDVVELIAV